jgi:hypothetical protein
MKASRLSIISTSLFAAAFLCSISTFAGNTIKKSLDLNESVTIQGVQLKPGTYKVEWSGSGPDVKLSILRGNDTLATVPAHIVQENVGNAETGYALKPAANGGPQEISEIFFSGQKYNLQLDEGSSQNSSGSPSGGSATN